VNVERQKHIFVWVICGLVLTAALVAGGVWAVRHDRAMHGALRELQEWNLADTVFRSDSAAQVLVDYFDHPWHSANDQMLAYYLLGRAYADMGEAPQAIEAYQTAIERADTTASDCDFRILRNVYGQMAEVFHAQNLPEDELKADSAFIHYSWVIGDTLEAISGYTSLLRPYFLLLDTVGMIRISQTAKSIALLHGYPQVATMTNIGIIDIYIARKDFESAKDGIRQIREDSGFFDREGNLLPGREMFYYTMASYFDAVNQLDSAEFYYRRVLSAGEDEAGYKGLLSVYRKRGIADSIAKFAPLYADANDAYHESLRTEEVHRTTSLYNYNRHLRQAQVSEQKANRRRTIIFILLVTIIILCTIGLVVIQRKKKKEQELALVIAHIEEDLRHAADKYSKTQEELHLAESQLQDYVTTKQNEIDELYEQQQQLKMLYESLKSKDKRALYYSSKAVVQIRSLAYSRKDAMTDSEWIELKAHFQAAFSHFCHMIEQRAIEVTENEWKVCVLLDLGLTTDDIAALMKQSAQRISNIKAQTNHLLFNERGGSGLSQNLRCAIHPEENVFSQQLD